MSNDYLAEEGRELQSKLLIPNVLICVVSIIVTLCLLFMPFIDIRISVKGDRLAALVKEEVSSSSSSSSSTAAAELDYASVVADCLTDIDLELPVNIYPMKAFKAARGTKADMEVFFNSLIGDGANRYVAELVDAVVPTVMKAAINYAIDTAFDELDEEIGSALDSTQKAQLENYKKDVGSIVDNLANGDGAQAKTAFTTLVNKIATEQGENAPDTEEIEQLFDEFVKQGTQTNGKFSFTYLLKNLDLDALESSDQTPTNPNAGSSVQLASVGEGAMDGGAENVGNSASEIAEIIEILENPGKLLADQLDDNTLSTIQTVLLAVLAVLVGIPLLTWGLLSLFSFIRIFTPNKRVKMWYVKMFAFWAFFIMLITNVAVAFLPKFLSGEMAKYAGVVGVKFLGSGIVTGAGWLFLVLLGWFYYNRVKKQIKRLYR